MSNIPVPEMEIGILNRDICIKIVPDEQVDAATPLSMSIAKHVSIHIVELLDAVNNVPPDEDVIEHEYR